MRIISSDKFLLISVFAFAITVAVSHGQDRTTTKAPAPDNTKINTRDRAPSQRTADQAKETVSDRDIMQQIRKAVVDDKSLSTYAHNVKIISEHGKVTLKGPVHTAQEKSAIEAKAVAVSGSGNVTNQISVKSDKSSK